MLRHAIRGHRSCRSTITRHYSFLVTGILRKISASSRRGPRSGPFRGSIRKTLERISCTRETQHRSDRARLENHFHQDRDKMESGESWTGLPLFLPEDIAITTSMTPICDRTKEHLVSADIGIAGMRKVLRDCATRVAEGKPPVGLDGSVPGGSAAIFVTEVDLDAGEDWRQLLPDFGQAPAVQQAAE
ncbi:hypothetical protein M9978_17005 [Sphingomonas sp. MG17]|uniref:LigXa-like C-terminal domain-containing protein n=1 Tax=Sphingomonas tagetis TaxID=2949092 RepID=A0A9X2HRD7_9SPHN|nr:hypothetical protein [Sphingomonas tagetis]